jgi:UDP-4-amino-4-deoxy-L-arabinose formyltransferase/UDP-glucuronic acid dehydrogenase (UDP-4-keto-hexauronic acid decarboxylating)
VRSPAFAERLQEVDLLLNVHSLHVVHPDVVAAPRIGSFNLHPGPLPEYAGLNVPSWAIYNGEETHGVTLHWMDDRIDAGPVAWLERFELTGDDTGLSVAGQCVRRGVPLLLTLVETAARNVDAIPRDAQDLARRRYFGAGPPEDGRLDWSAAAAAISRFVRAADYAPFPSPWGHPRAALGGYEVGIAKVAPTGVTAGEPPGTIHELTDAGAIVATGDELLVVQRVQANGRYAKPSELLRH